MSGTSSAAMVLGAGNYGTCLAQHLAEKGNLVYIWTRSAETAEAINQKHKNPKYLSQITLSSRIRAISILDGNVLREVGPIVLATPTQSMREVLGLIRPHLTSSHLLISACKGIEIGSLKLPADIIAEVLGDKVGERSAVLSGPSFAAEVVSRQPTAVSVASQTPESARATQALFHAAHFRVYTSDDPIGLEVAGALKNVIAIAAGAAKGIGYQANTTAALLTRGLAEITRAGVALGANPLTFNGLGGVGDLFLTCTSEKSRNFTVGFRLGRGESLQHIVQSVGSVAEGVTTAKAAKELGDKLGIELPIIEQVYKVLYEDKPIVQAVTDLITREAKPEIELPTMP
jgi:glycerol-3-phosphate dehydrogenase (NAD(P)+)